MRAAAVLLLSAAFSIVSCRTSTDPLSSVSAMVVPASVTRVVDPLSGLVEVSLSFSITNPTTAPIYYFRCGSSLERRMDDLRWESAASTICPAIAPANPLDGTVMIPAGESREVGAFMSGNGGSGLPATAPAGVYRVRFAVLSRNPVVYRGATGNQYRSTLLATGEFAITASN